MALKYNNDHLDYEAIKNGCCVGLGLVGVVVGSVVIYRRICYPNIELDGIPVNPRTVTQPEYLMAEDPDDVMNKQRGTMAYLQYMRKDGSTIDIIVGYPHYESEKFEKQIQIQKGLPFEKMNFLDKNGTVHSLSNFAIFRECITPSRFTYFPKLEKTIPEPLLLFEANPSQLPSSSPRLISSLGPQKKCNYTRLKQDGTKENAVCDDLIGNPLGGDFTMAVFLLPKDPESGDCGCLYLNADNEAVAVHVAKFTKDGKIYAFACILPEIMKKSCFNKTVPVPL